MNQRAQQVLGASDNTKITTNVTPVSMLNLWFKKDIKKAIDTSRLHLRLIPEEILAKRGINQTMSQELKGRSHQFNMMCI